MSGELLPDNYPIQASPIVITYSDSLDPSIPYIEPDSFAYSSLALTRSREIGLWSQEVTISTIIDQYNLAILPPETWRRLPDGHRWGPFEHADYFIEPEGLLNCHTAINDRIRAIGNGALATVTDTVFREAEQKLQQITDVVSHQELPPAFRSTVYLKELLNGGHVLGFEDFQDAARSIGTSAAKGAAVFDQLIKMLGDAEAIQLIRLLDTHVNPYARRDIRDQLYVSTQALANLVIELENNPEAHPEINPKSRALLRAILEDGLA